MIKITSILKTPKKIKEWLNVGGDDKIGIYWTSENENKLKGNIDVAGIVEYEST